jgi:hypothetical protein
MKSFFISAGLVAVGTAGLQSALADDSNASIPAPSPKIWSVSATLRGFYDDNYSTAITKKGSYGIELTPSVALNDSFTQTDIGIRYTYGLYWYQERQILGQNAFDQTHQLDFWLDHAFDERWKVNVTDTFASGQEPALLNGSGTPFRTEGNNIANHFNVDLGTQWTRELGSDIYYGNDFYDFQQTGDESLAALLNRDEQHVGADLKWTFDPETTVLIGYTFDYVDYVANEQIVDLNGFEYNSDSRNYYDHQFYVGLQHQFTANLGGSIKAGAEYVDSFNQTTPNSDNWSPYAIVSLTYTYLPGSYVQVGFSQGDNSTYVAEVTSSGALTQYQETSTVYGSINHHFTDKLIGSAIAQYTYSDFHGGPSLGPDVMYSAGLNLTYIINQYLSTDIGYNYDKLRSDVPGAGYERNRYYIGLTATY